MSKKKKYIDLEILSIITDGSWDYSSVKLLAGLLFFNFEWLLNLRNHFVIISLFDKEKFE